jgi:hypothetical protein
VGTGPLSRTLKAANHARFYRDYIQNAVNEIMRRGERSGNCTSHTKLTSEDWTAHTDRENAYSL